MRFRTHQLLCSLLLLLGLAQLAEAQYFGKNKVRYQDFEFRILETPHFDVYYYPAEQEAARQAGVLAERWYAELSERFNHQLSRRQPLVLYASHADFVQTNVIPGMLGEGTGGVTEGRRNRIILPFGLALAETDHVIGHELVHAFQFDLARAGNHAIVAMPLWFIEGMAEYLTLGKDHPQTLMWMRDIAGEERIPSLKDIENPKYFPYRYGHGVWRFLAHRFGEDVVSRLLRAKPQNLKARLKEVTGLTSEELSKAWHEALREEFRGDLPKPDLEPLLHRRATGARIHTAPALSPDGRQVAFVSEKDKFSIEIFVADVRTGEIRRKLVKRAADPHYDSLEFIDGAGAWDHEGRRFVFGATRGGAAVLAVVDARTGETERELRFEALGQVCNPAWSPDGNRLAFAGLNGGWSDLYIYDFPSGALRQLTRDAYADLQPAWSPDGTALAFATDRFSTDLGSLELGTYRLAMLDVASGSIRELPGTPGGRNITPQFGDAGRELFFVGDPDGRASVYRLRFDSGMVTRVTADDVPVSGITGLSPAISYAPRSGTLAYSVFRHGGYDIVTTTPGGGEGTGVAAVPEADTADSATDGDEIVASSKADEEAARFGVRPYRRKLSLESLGQPYVSAGGGSFGTFFRAGMGFGFGDMLGDQQLGVAFQVGRRKHDFAGRALYLNRRSRWNWGASVDFLPAVFGRAERQYQPSDQTVRRSVEYKRQSHFGVNGLVIYPFNRARRIELSAGFRQVTFSRQLQETVMSLPSRRELAATRETLPDGAPVRLMETSAAFVYDTAVFGPTSPILGRRSRIEVSPSFGTLDYTTLLADYRQYLMPVRPFTLALRGRYLTRVGGGAGDERLLPLVLSLRDQVRGYDLQALTARACGATQGRSCSVLDVMTGSSLVVANAELRFPIPGFLSGTFEYGPLPLEGFVFGDAASVRTRSGNGLQGWRQHMLRSVGTGVRVNAAGFIFEVAAARTFDRPGRGWTVAFNLTPGF